MFLDVNWRKKKLFLYLINIRYMNQLFSLNAVSFEINNTFVGDRLKSNA